MVEYEIISHEKIRGLHVFLNEIRMRSLHVHHDMEFLYVLKGQGDIRVKEKRFPVSPGDLILINAFDSHEISCMEEGILCIIIQISNHFLREYYPPLRNIIFSETEIRNCFPEEDYSQLIRDIYDLAVSYSEQKEYFELSCVSHVSDILLQLLKNVPYSVLEESEYSKRKKLNQRFNRIVSYIEANYQDQIRLSDIAEKEEITVTHLSHICRDYFGMNFQEYLKKKRLEHALRLLPDDSLSLSAIASASGFSELKYMNRAFEESFHMSPLPFRRKEETNRKKYTGSEPEHIYSSEEAVLFLQDHKSF